MSLLYIQVKKRITGSLISAEWAPGESIPSEIELAKKYNVSQGTVRKAIDDLVSDKILIRRQGKGTFVSSHNEENIQLRFLRLTEKSGKKENLESKLISFEKEKAGNQIAKSLGINPSSTLISIKRLLTFNGRPLILDLIKIPTAYFRGLTPEKIIEKSGSMYRMYEVDFGIQMLHADEKILAVRSSKESSTLLHVSEGSPLLSVERLSYTYDKKPIEWRLGLCLTLDHYYKTELE